jgi:glycosyltransferase involved in cell wall biosynthesis
MKVLMIAPQPFFEPRGTPISIYQRLEGLSRLGYDIDLVTYHLGEDVDIPGVRVYRTPKIPFINKLKVGPSWSKVPLDLFLFIKALGLLFRNRYDVIHSHEEAGFLAVSLAFFFRTYHLYDMHSSLPKQLVNFDFGNHWMVIKIFELLERMTIFVCDAMITIGPDLEARARKINPQVRQIMIENLPLRTRGKSWIQAPLEELKRRLGLNGKITVVYTGTFERYQGIDLLIKSARKVRDHTDGIAFILVGGRPGQIQEMQQLVRDLGLEDCVYFTGAVPIEEANQYLEMADILVSPRVEGTSVPLKIYTYLYAAKPILATDLIAHSTVLDDESAVLVEPSSDAFAEGLLSLISDPGLREQLSHQARLLAEEKYSDAVYLAKLEQIYQVFQPPVFPKKRPVHTLEN